MTNNFVSGYELSSDMFIAEVSSGRCPGLNALASDCIFYCFGIWITSRLVMLQKQRNALFNFIPKFRVLHRMTHQQFEIYKNWELTWCPQAQMHSGLHQSRCPDEVERFCAKGGTSQSILVKAKIITSLLCKTTFQSHGNKHTIATVSDWLV